MKKLAATITAFSHDGRGIAMIEGKTTFITGAIPGETVTYRITKSHTRYNEAEIIEILTPAHNRVVPPCVHYGVCGGCSMQHIAIDEQIALKQQTLLEQLKHFGQVVPEHILSPLTGNTQGYRRKARLGVFYYQKRGIMQIGFREKASDQITQINECLVLDPRVSKLFPALRKLTQRLAIYRKIAQIEVAIGDDTTALVFRHLTPMPEADLVKLSDFGKANNIHIYLQPNSPASIAKCWPQDDSHHLTYALSDYQLEMQFHPLDFTQINGEMNPGMIKQALALLAPNDSDQVLDLFCGLGNFTLPLARSAKHVVGVEGSQDMVNRATQNAMHNNITNTAFYAANLADIPAQRPAWMKKQYDKILLDPPRTGAKEIIALFPKFSAKRIVYVSCNPATLARDAGLLVHNQGYKLKQVGVINMFPHTSHIEAIALFEK